MYCRGFFKIHTSVNLTGILPQITMAVLESRSKWYDSEDWYYIWKHIIHHLGQEELVVFAPKACIAQADPQPPQSPPVVPFPFMKIPLELRSIVYKIHFSQPAEPHHLVPPSRSHVHVVSTNFRMDVAPSGLSMGGFLCVYYGHFQKTYITKLCRFVSKRRNSGSTASCLSVSFST